MNLTPLSLTKNAPKKWTNMSCESTRPVCSEQKLWNVTPQQIRPLCSGFRSMLRMIKSRGKHARGGNEFPPPRSLLLSHLLLSLTTAPHKAKPCLCLFPCPWWMAATAKPGSRATRDRNMLAHASEWFGWIKQGGRNLHFGKPGAWQIYELWWKDWRIKAE